MSFKRSILAATVTALALNAGMAIAKVSPEEAAKLGNELTPFGAERAGNADGSIPEWTGGLTTAPAGYTKGGQLVDPFADEKPLYTVTSQNLAEYGDMLSDGQKALFAKYPDFKMNVYPTHRTAPIPDWVAENTKTNALNAELTPNGNGVTNAYGGIPFPIPQNGNEAIWNHTLRWYGEGKDATYESATIYANGSRAVTAGHLIETYPYYYKDGDITSFNGNIIQLLLEYSLPTRRKGEVTLVRDPVNAAKEPRQAWQYIPGQRRVRRAPTIAFDTPDPGSNGLTTYDQAFMFNGSPERYNWELIGKKEMLVPYNSYKFLTAHDKGTSFEELWPTNFTNPDFERWEKHRVWVVEATLREDSRHIYGKRRFYLDEDSWFVLMTDMYDGRGELWRYGHSHPVVMYGNSVIARAVTNYDLQSGDYAVQEYDTIPYTQEATKDDNFYTPQNVRQMARR
ncbi:hypothetical protein GCM10011348_11900 [Marinobacterium nitratireducens]|uniref:Outer membrane lipoprotein-sorting protein n=1 Tax=Marinobacterium nitratireducens TaxID=518897 RepID=A0A917ZC81_9GAMM|nr:DUF1329 domain-containing protein [Marinobacterium nitratireducens]GGO78909.1 hypothetical protein GCM10011348_11900 [Marinobacterium nitratireducens]